MASIPIPFDSALELRKKRGEPEKSRWKRTWLTIRRAVRRRNRAGITNAVVSINYGTDSVGMHNIVRLLQDKHFRAQSWSTEYASESHLLMTWDNNNWPILHPDDMDDDDTPDPQSTDASDTDDFVAPEVQYIDSDNAESPDVVQSTDSSDNE